MYAKAGRGANESLGLARRADRTDNGLVHRGKEAPMLDHDQRFKTLIQTFFWPICRRTRNNSGSINGWLRPTRIGEYKR